MSHEPWTFNPPLCQQAPVECLWSLGLVASPGILGLFVLKEDRGGFLHDPFSFRDVLHDIFANMFLICFSISIFYDFSFNKPPKNR